MVKLRWPILECVIFVLLAAGLGFFSLENLDLGRHLRAGEWMHENGLMRTNVLSFVYGDRPYVNDQWLFQWCLYPLEQWFGLSGLVATRWILVILLAFLLLGASGDGARHPLGVVLLGVALLGAQHRFLLSPELLSFLFVAVQLIFILRPPSWKAAILWLPLQVLWTNTHGYFVLGPLFFAAACAGAFVQRGVARDRSVVWLPRLALLGASLVGAAGHAYGWPGTIHPWRILQDLRENYEFYSQTVLEFHPTLAYREIIGSHVVVALALAVVVVLALCFRRRKLDFAGLAVVLVAAAGSLVLIRNVPLFAITAAPWLAQEVARLYADRQYVTHLPRVVCHMLRGLAIVSLALPLSFSVTGGFALSDRGARTLGWGFNPDRYPERAAAFLQREGLEERVGCSFAAGSYLLWRLRPPEGKLPKAQPPPEESPAGKPQEGKPQEGKSQGGKSQGEQSQGGVFIDGNINGYPVAFLQWHGELFAGALHADAAARRYDLKSFLCDWDQGLANQLWNDPAWIPVFGGRTAVVFVRAESDEGRRLGHRDLRDAVERGWTPSVAPESGWDGSRYPGPLRAAVWFFQRAGQYATAQRLLDQLDPEFAELYEFLILRGIVKYQSGEVVEGTRLLERACQRNPRSVQALTTRARVFEAQREFELAYADLNRAAKLRPDAEVSFRQGRIAEMLGLDRAAVEHFRRAADQAPNNVKFAIGLIQRLVTWPTADAHTEARRRIRDCLRLSPDRSVRAELEALRRRLP